MGVKGRSVCPKVRSSAVAGLRNEIKCFASGALRWVGAANAGSKDNTELLFR